MKNLKIKAALLLAALASGSALANPTPAEAAMTSISTEASTLIAAGWPILVTVVVAGIGMKLFKKFASKST